MPLTTDDTNMNFFYKVYMGLNIQRCLRKASTRITPAPELVCFMASFQGGTILTIGFTTSFRPQLQSRS